MTDPTQPCLRCNRYTCRCNELAEDTDAATTTIAVPVPRDWTPWWTSQAANA